MRSETASALLAGSRLSDDEHTVLAAYDRTEGRLDDPGADYALAGTDGAVVGGMILLADRTDEVGQRRFARLEETWEVDELVTEDELEEAGAGAKVARA